MKSILFLLKLLILAIGSFSLVACGGAEDTEDEGDAEAQTEEAEGGDEGEGEGEPAEEE